VSARTLFILDGIVAGLIGIMIGLWIRGPGDDTELAHTRALYEAEIADLKDHAAEAQSSAAIHMERADSLAEELAAVEETPLPEPVVLEVVREVPVPVERRSDATVAALMAERSELREQNQSLRIGLDVMRTAALQRERANEILRKQVSELRASITALQVSIRDQGQELSLAETRVADFEALRLRNRRKISAAVTCGHGYVGGATGWGCVAGVSLDLLAVFGR